MQCYFQDQSRGKSGLRPSRAPLGVRTWEAGGLQDGEGPTFDGHVDTLTDGKLWLDENAAQVLSLIHALLHIRQLESPILKHHLAVVIG